MSLSPEFEVINTSAENRPASTSRENNVQTTSSSDSEDSVITEQCVTTAGAEQGASSESQEDSTAEQGASLESQESSTAEQGSSTEPPAEIPNPEDAVLPVPNFSICIICKDGAPTLPRLAASLQHFLKAGGDVTLLDTGSSDATIQVAKELGFNVHESAPGIFTAKMSKLQAKTLLDKYADAKDVAKMPFRNGVSCFNFSAARNAVAKLAKHDLILHLDASDQVLSLDIDYINTLLASGLNCLYYNLSNRLESSNAESIATANRFFDRRLQKWEGLCHEEVYSIDGSTSSQIRMASVPTQGLAVTHWRQTTKTRDGYLIGVALDVVQHPQNAQMLHNLGRQFFYSNFEASALKVLAKHLQKEYSLTSRRSLSACFIAQIWVKRGEAEQIRVKAEIEEMRRLKKEPDERTVLEMAKRVTTLYENARTAYLDAFQLDCEWRAPIIGLSDLAMRMKDYDRAIFWAISADTIKRTSMVSENGCHYTYAIDEILMRAFFGLWKAANEGKQSNANELFGQSYAAYERCKAIADWLPSVKKFGELFQYDENYARQSVMTGDFKE